MLKLRFWSFWKSVAEISRRPAVIYHYLKIKGEEKRQRRQWLPYRHWRNRFTENLKMVVLEIYPSNKPVASKTRAVPAQILKMLDLTNFSLTWVRSTLACIHNARCARQDGRLTICDWLINTPEPVCRTLGSDRHVVNSAGNLRRVWSTESEFGT